MKLTKTLLASLAIVFIFGISASAQIAFDTGRITGAIQDPSGAAVPQATVTINNVGTGIVTTAHSDSSGSFVASGLPSGDYVVSATKQGFGVATSQSVTLSVGAIVNVVLKLPLASTRQSVTVTGTPTTVNTSSSASGERLDASQIANLPINGRDVSQFLEIAPGSVGSTGFFQGSVNGQENVFTGLNVTVDGQAATRGDINGFLMTEGQEAAHITRASMSSIGEIVFQNNGYSAEVGHSLGPQMNIITKSGKNAFHGELFEYLRNDALDARDFFQNTVSNRKAPLRLNDFGGNLGGPIMRNKAFFFVNYEGIRQHITNINSLYEIPSAYVRSQFVPSMQPVLAQMAPLPANPTCALPEAGTSNCLLVYDPAALPVTDRENTGSIRVDYNLTEKDHLMFRYNINDSLTNYTYGLNQGQVSPQALRTQLGKFDWTHIVSPTLLNEFGVGITRFNSDTNSNTPTPLAGFAGFFTNLGALPGPNTFNQKTPFTFIELFENLTKTFSKHTLKFGTQIRVNRLNTWLRPQQTYYYGSFSDLANNNPFVLSKIGFPGFLGMRNSNWDFYAQDDWKVRPNLTLNFGLRYDYNTVWSEQHNRMRNFDFATQSFYPANQAAYTAPKSDFAPRVGFAWDPTGKGTTVIHGYGGIFYIPMQFGFGLTSNIPEFASYNVNVFQAIFADPPFSIAYPSPNPPLIAGTQNVSIFPRNPKDPYSINWLFGIQQQLARGTILTVNYTGNGDRHMQAGASFAAVNLNAANIVTQARPYSGYANENFFSDSLTSSYNALQVQFKRHVGKLQLNANYSWSHEIDNLVNVFSGWSNPFNPGVDRGSGDWDVRHNFSASYVYSLPELKSSEMLMRGILGGWQTSSIVQGRTGLPVNVQLVSGFFGTPIRPNYVPGQPVLLANGHWPDSSYNINAFAVQPNYDGSWGLTQGIGRNALRGPGFFQWDFSMMKNFRIHEKATLQFRADIFNLFNHPNFANPDGGICTSVTPASGDTPAGCVVNPNFGRVGQTIADNLGSQIGTGTARQVQFALKLLF